MPCQDLSSALCSDKFMNSSGGTALILQKGIHDAIGNVGLRVTSDMSIHTYCERYPDNVVVRIEGGDFNMICGSETAVISLCYFRIDITKEFADKVLGQHYIISYGDNVKQITEYCKMNGIEVI